MMKVWFEVNGSSYRWKLYNNGEFKLVWVDYGSGPNLMVQDVESNRLLGRYMSTVKEW
jgi:hypothetical protein